MRRGGREGGPLSKCGSLATYGSRRASTSGASLKIDPASQLAKARPLISCLIAGPLMHRRPDAFHVPARGVVPSIRRPRRRAPRSSAGSGHPKRQTVLGDLRGDGPIRPPVPSGGRGSPALVQMLKPPTQNAARKRGDRVGKRKIMTTLTLFGVHLEPRLSAQRHGDSAWLRGETEARDGEEEGERGAVDMRTPAHVAWQLITTERGFVFQRLIFFLYQVR